MPLLDNFAIFDALFVKANPILQNYKTDLYQCDAELIRKCPLNPCRPFLHLTRAYGTHLLWLYPHDDADLPARDVMVPFLFGQADREHIIKSTVESLRALGTMSVQLVLHFDGKELHEVTFKQAEDIARDYVAAVLQAWNPTRR